MKKITHLIFFFFGVLIFNQGYSQVDCPVIFEATGALQTYTVPAGVTSINIEASGSQGGNGVNQGGNGATLFGTFPVIPGETLQIIVGDRRANNSNGGGATFIARGTNGFSDFTPANILLIAGGGGGGAPNGAGGASTILETQPSGNGGTSGTTSGVSFAGGGGTLSNDGAGNRGGDAAVNGASGGPGFPGTATGGFGGGGGGDGGAGGGGGVTGGNGGSDFGTRGTGGTSYNGGSATTFLPANNTGTGRVAISIPGGTPDTTPPVIMCSDIILSNDPGICGAIATFDPVTTDECDFVLEQTAGLPSGSVFPVGTSTVTFTAIDSSDNSSTCSFTITVNDNEAPVINPQDITVDLGNNGMASITIEDITQPFAPTYSVNQSGTFNPIDISLTGTNVSLGDDAVSGALPIDFSFDFFNISYTNFRIGSNGFITFNNSASSGCCSGQNIPNTSTPNNLIALAWEDLDPDNGGQPTENVIRYETIGVAPNRILVVEYFNVDHFSNGNNITTQAQLYEGTNIIEIHTTNMPTDGGLHTQGVENSNGTIGIPTPGRNRNGSWSATNDFVAFIPRGIFASDNCGVASTSIDISTFDCSNIGTNNVTINTTDINGNSTSFTSVVTIEDNIAPIPDIVTLTDVTALCEVATLTTPNATDNCTTTLTITNDVTLPITTEGTTVVTWTYDDGNGNTTTQTQNIIITDDVTPPVPDIAMLADVTDECEVTTLTAPTATDNCATTITITNNATLPISGEGTTTVITWTYDDENGNTTTQTQNIVIDDVTAPVPDIPTLADVTAECEVTALTPPTATDNCNGNVTVTNDATLPISGEGTTTVITWIYDDGNGNTTTQTQNIVIDDVTAPVPDIANLTDITAECEVIMLTPPTATDNCGGTVIVTNDTTLPISTQGTTVITWTYDDGNGNTTTQTENIVIDDVTAPVPDIPILADVTAECEVTTLIAPTATDNCSNATVTVTNDATLPIVTQGTTIVTWTYDDGNGNTATQTQNIVIDDVTVPVPDILTLADVTAECEVTVLTPPTATDNCNGTVIVTNDVTLPIATQGTTIITWTYDDGNGNTASQTQNIIIDDVTAPVPDLTTLPDITAQCEVTGLTPPTATDNCNGNVTVTNDATLPIAAQGSTVVTWTYDDGNGNTATQTQNVIILGSDIVNATLENESFVYDGSVRSLIVNNIPTNATVTYTNNNQTEAGVYNVTATINSASTDCPIIILNAILTIERAPQTISFNPLTPRNLIDDTDFQLTATSSSGLPTNFTASPQGTDAAAAVNTSGFVTLQNIGFITITANQPGDNNHLPAIAVSQQLEVFLNNDASLEAIIINGTLFSNPSQTINYTINCDNQTDAVLIELINNTGASFSPAQEFDVDTPQPGIYRQEVLITAQDGITTRDYLIIIERQFEFNDIVEQKFNNLLVVNNNPLNNGGYNFIAYEWFKNGNSVSTEQFFSEGPDRSDVLDPNALYSVQVTLSNGDIIRTCEAIIENGNTFSFDFSRNPVSDRNLRLIIDISLNNFDNQNTFLDIYDIRGRHIARHQVNDFHTNILLPNDIQEGIYLVSLSDKNSRITKKVIIK